MEIKSTFSRPLFLLFLFSINVSVWAQSAWQGSIPWLDKMEDSEYTSRLNFEGANYDLDNQSVPKFCDSKRMEANADNYVANFDRVSYEPVSSSEIKVLKTMRLNAVPDIEVYGGAYRGVRSISICFYPFVVQNGEYKRVVDYKVSLTQINKDFSNGAPKRKKSAAVSHSVLNQEGWFKMSVEETGLHKITPGFLSDNDISSSAIGINDLRIVGNGDGMLVEDIDVSRAEDLLDVPLKIFDNNNDGLFNGSDYAVFYAKGPHTWSLNKTDSVFEHRMNVYRTKNFYFVSVTAGSGKSLAQAAPSGASNVSVTSFDDYQFVEDEKYNLVGTGRQWFGDVFDFTKVYNYSFNFPNIDLNTPARLKVRAVGRASTGNTFLATKLNAGQQLLSNTFTQLPGGDHPPHATVKIEEGYFTPSTSGFNLTLEYDNSSNPAGVAWLDYIEVQVRRNLTYNGAPLYFRDIESVGPNQMAEFVIASAVNGLQIWDVTNPNKSKEIQGVLVAGQISFTAPADSLREYVAFKGSSMAVPEFVGAVEPQNLHGLGLTDILIVTHPNFMDAAVRLGEFHLQQDSLSYTIATVNQIYNEFSSGGQDITAIRDFARFLYKKDSVPGVSFDYLILMGDASYDYKGILNTQSNFVPLWESSSSLSLHASSVTDDYFAFLDDGEGDSSFSGQSLDLAVGRIPCATLKQAQGYVSKVEAYSLGANRFGDWRNKLLLIADDVEKDWEDMFVKNSESFEKLVNNKAKCINVDKVYTDSYVQVSSTGSQSYPEAQADIFRKVQQGVLVANYIGHGGEIGLSSEKILGLNEVNGWNNKEAMALFMTITCEFTRLDDPKRVSAGEQLCLNPNGGSIGLVSTTRVVGANPAVNLNREVFKVVFERNNNQPKTMGAIVRDAKNADNNNGTRLKFSFFGDPALKLALPNYNMSITKFNGKPVNQGNLDTLKAFSKVLLEGIVSDHSQQKMVNFNGVANVSVYDKPVPKRTRVNDGEGNPINFKLQNSLIYRGKVRVVNGDFKVEFFVPKDIAYHFGTSRISMYASNGDVDAGGCNDSIIVGGFGEAIADNAGPEIELYINDETFVRGGITDENPELYAILVDSSGINTVGNSIGHDLVAILDNRTDLSYVVNEYYEADLDSYQSGIVRYPFYDLAEGAHTLKLKVFDIHNNLSEAETDFIVADSEEMALEKVLNYPNPFTTHTDFQFEHNRVSQPLQVQVQIFTVSGKLVKTIHQTVVPEGNRVTGITWNGLDDFGDKIGKGTYIYRVKVKSEFDRSTAEKYEKLVILR